MWSFGTICSRRAERGFVLATTLLVTTLLTVMLAASFLLVSAEQRTTDNSLGTARALVLAQAGLQVYFDSSRGLDTSSTYDSTRITLSGGYADVVGRRVRPAGATLGSPLALWVVRSTGVATTAVMAGQIQGTRTIAQFAQFNPGLLPARAAMVAVNGVSITQNGTYPISGNDLNKNLCPQNPGGNAADTFGVSVAQTLYSASGSTPSGNGYPTTVDSLPYPTNLNLYDSTHIDWAGLLAGNFIPDYTIPPGSWPTPGSNKYLVGYVSGDVTIPASSGGVNSAGMRGMLIVTGNVTVSNNTHWDGIIVAGGRLAAGNNVNYRIHGMIITGLNEALGQNVQKNSVPRGNLTIQWAWCYTQSSVNALASLVPIRNAWADTWTSY